jgi:uncharacterized YigZ family protein
MMFDDTYRTIAESSEGLFKDKGSKFIAIAFSADSEEQFKEILIEIKKQYHDARHHCYAYMIGPDKSCSRSNDDGEPNGTAGKPVLNQILSLDLTNIGVVVVRYFGGTKLGVSGLINAYKTASREALEHATIVEKTINEIYSLHFNYPLMNEVMRVMKEEQLEQLNTRFEMTCYLEFSVRKKIAEKVAERFENIFGVKIKYIKTV